MSPLDADQLLAEASTLLEQGDINPALRRLQDAVRLAPDQPRYWLAFAGALRGAHRLEDAAECFTRAAALDPASIDCRSQLGFLLAQLSRVEEAIHWHGEALQRQPDSLMLQLNHRFVFPLVASSLQEIETCRQRCTEGLAGLLHDSSLRLLDHEFGAHTFRLAYHGRNDRALLEAYGDLLSRFSTELDGPALAPPGLGSGAGPRYRIGFLSAYFHEHSNTRAFEGLIAGLDRDRFELVLLPLDGSPSDGVRSALEACCDRVVSVPAPAVDGATACLRRLRLDLLFFTDVGMNAFTSALVTRRHAPVQVAGWGIPHTSGFPCIDHYISGDLVEPPRAQDYYRENLVQLPGLPCRYLSSSLPLPPENLPRIREYFLLPAESKIFGCLQNFQKLHPDFDGVLEAIARRLPDALFVMVEPRVTHLAQIFLDRIATSAPTLAQRLLLLARMSRSEFMGLARCLDLILDPLHYGSGITMFETMASGTPTIALEGPFLRSRFVAGAYRQMGLADAPIASSIEEYVELAVALMSDDEKRLVLRQKIRNAAIHHLYDRLEMVRGFEDFAVDAISRARSCA